VSKEKLLEHCKNWFIENNKVCPKTAREWKGTGTNIPPNSSITVLRRYGLKPADIINHIYGEGTATTNRTHNITEILSKVGLEEVFRDYDCLGKYTLTYKCLTCETIDSTDQTTVVRWGDRNVRGCPLCNKSSGKQKPIEYYQKLVPGFIILERLGSATFKLECNKCNFQFTRSRTHVTEKETETVCCPNCSDNIAYIKGQAIGFDSRIEKELVEYLEQTFPNVQANFQVPYRTFLPTTRKFTADIFLPEFLSVIEISSKSNKLPNYSNRLEEKRLLCQENNVSFYFCTNKTQLNDIVRSFIEK